MTMTGPYHVMTLASPIGKMVAAASDDAVIALTWNESDLDRLNAPERRVNAKHPLLRDLDRQLREYFAGRRKEFDLPLDMRGTDFQRRVWKELQRIPFEETCSYADIAERVGAPKAVRAVGSANGKNPVCIIVPCHRVVRASGEMGGYAGGLKAKAYLLKLEGNGSDKNQKSTRNIQESLQI